MGTAVTLGVEELSPAPRTACVFGEVGGPCVRCAHAGLCWVESCCHRVPAEVAGGGGIPLLSGFPGLGVIMAGARLRCEQGHLCSPSASKASLCPTAQLLALGPAVLTMM